MNRYPTNRSLLISIALATVALVSSSAGCSRVPCYKGYVPVTEEEAQAFGRELIERAARGDKSWYEDAPLSTRRTVEWANASAAVLYFYGLDIPEMLRDPAKTIKEEAEIIGEERLAKMEEDEKERVGRMGDPVFLEAKPTFNTYTVYFEFQRADGDNRKESYTLVKNKKTGEIVIAGCGMSLPRPKRK